MKDGVEMRETKSVKMNKASHRRCLKEEGKTLRKKAQKGEKDSSVVDYVQNSGKLARF